MKKLLIFILLVFVLVGLTGCDLIEAKKQARQYVKQYSKDFEQQVKLEYGENAKLKNIRCEVVTLGARGVLPEISFGAKPLLEAELILNDHSYYANYYIATNTVSSDMYLTNIINEFVTYMPIDSEKIVYWYSHDNSIGDKMAFESSIKNLSDAAEKESRINIYVITTEDLYDIGEKSFKESKIIDFLANKKMTFSFTIFSVYDVEKIDYLKSHINSIKVLNDDFFDSGTTNGEVLESDNIKAMIYFSKNSYNDGYTYSGYNVQFEKETLPWIKENYDLTDIEIEDLKHDYYHQEYNFWKNFVLGYGYNNPGGDGTLFQVDKSNYDGKSAIDGKIVINSGIFNRFLVDYSYLDKDNLSREDEAFLKTLQSTNNNFTDLDYLFKIQNYGISKPEYKLNSKGEEYYYLLDKILIINGDISPDIKFDHSSAKKIRVTVNNDMFSKDFDLMNWRGGHQMLDVGLKIMDVTKPITIEIEVLETYGDETSSGVYIGVISPMIKSNIVVSK